MKKSILFVCIIVLCMVLMSATPSHIVRLPIVKYTDEAMEEAINEVITDNLENELSCLMLYSDYYDSTKIKFTLEPNILRLMTQYPDTVLFIDLPIIGMQILKKRNKVVIFNTIYYVDFFNRDSMAVGPLPKNHNLFLIDTTAKLSRKSVWPFRLDRNNNVVVNFATYGGAMLFMEPYIYCADLVKLDCYDIVDEDLSSKLEEVFKIFCNDEFANYVCNFEQKDGCTYINVISQPKAAIIDSDIWWCAEYDGKKLLLSGAYNDNAAFVANGKYKYFVSTDYKRSFLDKYCNFVPDSASVTIR